MARFQGVDFLDCDSLLDEDERTVRDTIRKWVDDRLLPVIQECYVDHVFPRQLVPEMAELGIFGHIDEHVEPLPCTPLLNPAQRVGSGSSTSWCATHPVA